ncbi:hypothetical protein MHU86_10706 [Fragilaria crotonensis]|nr:hypothetical protein MHU86_10706 [Fragilaria crotonensis]
MMRLENISLLLFASLCTAYAKESAYDLVNQRAEFRELRGQLKRKPPKVCKQAPVDGSPCTKRKTKPCVVGSRVCPNIGARPATSCFCDNAAWKCEAIPCPVLTVGTTIAAAATFCPEESPVMRGAHKPCKTEGQACSFEYESTFSGTVCNNKDRCACAKKKWECDSTASCVSANPIFIVGCPAESPLVTNVTNCDAEHQESPCSFEYPSTIPGGICTSQDGCTCNSGTWDCTTSFTCVSANPPVVGGTP